MPRKAAASGPDAPIEQVIEVASRARVHASCVRIREDGVLLRGPSGCGKSDLALRLIDGGAILVADDQLWVERVEDHLVARPVEALRGMIEVRGLGIVGLPHASSTRLDLVVDLCPADEVERWPERRRMAWMGIDLPWLALDPRLPSAAAVIRTALVAQAVA